MKVGLETSAGLCGVMQARTRSLKSKGDWPEQTERQQIQSSRGEGLVLACPLYTNQRKGTDFQGSREGEVVKIIKTKED